MWSVRRAHVGAAAGHVRCVIARAVLAAAVRAVSSVLFAAQAMWPSGRTSAARTSAQAGGGVASAARCTVRPACTREERAASLAGEVEQQAGVRVEPAEQAGRGSFETVPVPERLACSADHPALRRTLGHLDATSLDERFAFGLDAILGRLTGRW